MSAFDPATDPWQDRALRMLQQSPVTLFSSESLFDEQTAWLSDAGYQIVSLDARAWTEDSMHRAIASALDFPSYYGGNLDALNDCLADVVAQDYGWDASSTGLVLAISAFDRFARADPRVAHGVLDVIACQSRQASLIGRRLLCLIQSGDPGLRFEPIGSSSVEWNDAEWKNADRTTEQ